MTREQAVEFLAAARQTGGGECLVPPVVIEDDCRECGARMLWAPTERCDRPVCSSCSMMLDEAAHAISMMWTGQQSATAD